MRAGARPAWEIASCGAGAAGLKPRGGGVRVELRERAGAAFARPGVAASANLREALLLAGKTWGPDAPRARQPYAQRCPARGRRVLGRVGGGSGGATPGLEEATFCLDSLAKKAAKGGPQIKGNARAYRSASCYSNASERLRARELGDGLGALGHGVLGEPTTQ